MKILVACEESQAVTIELRKLGHEAYSCDLQPCTGGHPEWHLQQDVTPLLKEHWGMIIAFPPCTYLSNAGARHLYKGGQLNRDRYEKGLAAKDFFLKFLHAECPRIAIENPVSSTIFNLPPCTQEIQPWQFGHPVTKKTRLWLKGLPKLKPTCVVEPKQNCHDAGTWFMKGGVNRQLNRAKTFQGVARAMARQWTSAAAQNFKSPIITLNFTEDDS